MLKGRTGFTLAEMVVTIAVLGVILSIALPHFLQMNMAANEAAVIEAMRSVVHACESYRTQGTARGVGEAPPSLASLVNTNPPYLDNRFSGLGQGNNWRGYSWNYAPGPVRNQVVGNAAYAFRDTYQLTADPIQRGVTGQRSFYTDQSGMVRFNVRGPAGPNDQVLE